MRDESKKPGRLDRPSQLYRCYDAEGRLLYVGVSVHAMARLSEHRDKPWKDAISRVDVEPHPDRKSAFRAETEAIRKENPLHNIAKVSIRPEPVPTDFKINIRWTKAALALLEQTDPG